MVATIEAATGRATDQIAGPRSDSIVGSPLPGERKLCGFFREALDMMQTDRHRHDHVWWENGRFVQGNMWPWYRPLWKASPSTNFCSTSIIPAIALLTDSRPKPEVQALDPANYHVAAALEAGIEWVLRDNDFDLLLPKVLLTAGILGTGFLEVDYDQFRKKIVVRQRDTYDVWTLGGMDVEDCEFVAVRSWLPLWRIRQMYPTQGSRVDPETDDVGSFQSGERRPRDPVPGGQFLRQTFTQYDLTGKNPHQYYSPNSSPTDQSLDYAKGASVWQFYFRDPDRQKYPTWRHVTLTSTVVLADRPIKTRNGRIPLIKWNNFDWDSEFWGRSEIQDVKPLNVTYNMLYGIILDMLRLGAQPPLLVSSMSGIDDTTWQARPAMVKQFDDRGGKPYWMPTMQINPALFNLLSMIESQIRVMTGAGDAAEGNLPFKGASGVLMAQMRESSQTRIRAKGRALEVLMKRLGEQLVSSIQQFWTYEQILPLVGPMAPDRLAAMQGLVGDPTKGAGIVLNKFVDVLPAKIPGEKPTPVVLNDVTIGQYLVRVNGTSSLAMSRRAQLAEAVELFKIGAVDRQYVWNLLVVPEQEKIRMMAVFEAQAAAMQAAQGAPQGTQAGPPPGGPPGGPPPGGVPNIPVGSAIGSGSPVPPPNFMPQAA